MSNLCDKAQAIALQKFTKPATRRFFYACARWAAIVFLLEAIGSLLTGCDDLAAAQPASHAAQQAQAEHRRDLAASQMCKGSAFEWEGSVLTCHKER